ncbi:unnamed protein product [Lampetra fluviatilis]
MEWNSSSSSSSSEASVSGTLILIAGLLREPAGTRPLVFAVVLIFYSVALVGNLLLCAAIYRDTRLHRPMFILLANLAISDVVGCSATLPRIMRDLTAPNLITVRECVAQMIAIHFYRALECFVLSAMALDRYVAICRPLRYHGLATNGRALAVNAAAAAASAALVAPMLALALRLQLTDCPRPKLVPTAHCDNIALVNMACSDGSVNNAYGVALTTLTVGSSLTAVVFSYACIVHECLARRGHSDSSSSAAAFGKSTAANDAARSTFTVGPNTSTNTTTTIGNNSTVGPNTTTNKNTTTPWRTSTICPSTSTAGPNTSTNSTTTGNTSTVGPNTSTNTTTRNTSTVGPSTSMNTTARSTSAVGPSTSADTATTATTGGSSTIAPKTPIAIATPGGTGDAFPGEPGCVTASVPIAGKGSRAQHSRAVSTCVTHLLVLAVFYAPLLFAVVYNRVDKLVPIPAPLRQALTCLFYAAPPALNPVIYGLRTGAIRRAVVAMVPRHRTGKGFQSSTLSLVSRSV